MLPGTSVVLHVTDWEGGGGKTEIKHYSHILLLCRTWYLVPDTIINFEVAQQFEIMLVPGTEEVC